ncbi:hypothetical protein Dsin_013976 [Dipteronia sinensis]|uniref:Uncharacterized protein n=1 Tax=Dipteronia sinensis TaxID=43782 RepID=A0AAE0AL18_9ROSI|nr:hypothetical protein Dsin_013976 [Dipteronia sinensis]
MANNKQLVLNNYVNGVIGVPQESHMYLSTASISSKVEQEYKIGVVLVKNLYLACDPYMRIRMGNHQNREFGNFIPGYPINGFGVAKVLDSTHLSFKEGDFVWGTTGWEEYSVITTPERLCKIHYTDVPLSYYAGILGMPGLTAYVGFFEICSPKTGDHVFVSAASGAVGQLVGQFAKFLGCHVVGSREKVELLKDRLGFDGAFNYKEEPDLNAALKRRIRMQGFVVFDYCSMYPKFLDMVLPYLREGRLVYVEDITEGILNGPAAFLGIFTGKCFGKKVIKVSGE